jgi:hypothetical protein
MLRTPLKLLSNHFLIEKLHFWPTLTLMGKWILLLAHGVSFFNRYLGHVLKSFFALVEGLSFHMNYLLLQVVGLANQQVLGFEHVLFQLLHFIFILQLSIYLKTIMQFFFLRNYNFIKSLAYKFIGLVKVAWLLW